MVQALWLRHTKSESKKKGISLTCVFSAKEEDISQKTSEVFSKSSWLELGQSLCPRHKGFWKGDYLVLKASFTGAQLCQQGRTVLEMAKEHQLIVYATGRC